MVSPEQKPCAACGSTFGCGAAVRGCWCEDVAVPSTVNAGLAAQYDDCLCPACLASAAAEHPPRAPLRCAQPG